MILVYYTLFIIGTYISAYILYDLILMLVHFFIRDKDIALLSPKTRFGIIVPAHNEELLLARLLQSINTQNYPPALCKCIVIADNCTDKTVEVALKNGAIVLERNDPQSVGKGYAIKFSLENIDMNAHDALFIIDADSIIENDLLRQLDHVVKNGNEIIQCYNGVANPNESWFTRLLDVSRTIGNEIYHPAKQKLGLASYLMGNGMCFSSKILSKYGWDAFTIGEDWEYYARLAQDGETVAFAGKARVYHQESSSLSQATSQRMRWSSGRFAVAANYGLKLFCRGLLERNIRKLDASLPLIFPNPSLGTNITVIGLALSLLLPVSMNRNHVVLWFSSLVLVQFLIFMIGILYTRSKFKNLLSLFVAPLFLVWKMWIDIFSALGMGRGKWIRTERKL